MFRLAAGGLVATDIGTYFCCRVHLAVRFLISTDIRVSPVQFRGKIQQKSQHKLNTTLHLSVVPRSAVSFGKELLRLRCRDRSTTSVKGRLKNNGPIRRGMVQGLELTVGLVAPHASIHSMYISLALSARQFCSTAVALETPLLHHFLNPKP